MLDGFLGKSGGFWQDAAENSAAKRYASGGGSTNKMGRARMATSAHMQKGMDAEFGEDPMQMLSGLLSIGNATKSGMEPGGGRNRLPIYDLIGLLGGQGRM